MFLAVGDGRDFKEHAEERDAIRKKIMAANKGIDLTDDEGFDEDDENLLEEKDQLTK